LLKGLPLAKVGIRAEPQPPLLTITGKVAN